MGEPVPKILGADFELANFIEMPGHPHGRASEAANLLLAEIHGFPRGGRRTYSQIDYRRRFLAQNGGSFYIDSEHLEGCTPEHASAFSHALHMHAGLRLARRAQLAAGEGLPRGAKLTVLANNCDGHVSYGCHLNVQTTAKTFADIMGRKPHAGGLLATHLATSLPYTGQGMAGAANGRSACHFQLSQRADWIETFASIDTMQRRPLINQRDEPHAGDDLARIHIIPLDFVLMPIANVLRAGTTQLVLAMCEAKWIDPAVALDDPVAAVSCISRDLSMTERFVTATRGKTATALDLQQEILQLAGEALAAGVLGDSVPGAGEILHLWQETLDLLRRRDLPALARRCDNWLKYLLLDRRRNRHGLAWESSELKALDLRYSSLDLDEGLFFQMAHAGCIEGWPGVDAIERCADEPPDNTRAYLRSHVLRRWGADVSDMDWSWIDFQIRSHRGWWSLARIAMPEPHRHTRYECEQFLQQCESLDDLVEAYGDPPLSAARHSSSNRISGYGRNGNDDNGV